METSRCSIRVYIRKYKLRKDGKASLLIRLTVNGRRWDSALKVGVDPKEWDQQKERATGDDSTWGGRGRLFESDHQENIAKHAEYMLYVG